MNISQRARSGRNAREGFILVALLGVMALMAGLVGSTTLLVRAAFDGARANGDVLALDGLTRAGLDLAGYQLYALKLPPALVDGQDIRLDDGTVRLSITDEAGRIDLNGADPVLLASAYASAGASSLSPVVFAQKVIVWRNRNDRPATTGNPSDPPATPRKDGFGSVQELSRLPGLSAADLAVLRPLLTVGNPGGKVNVMSAGPAVLRALPEMTDALVSQIIALRRPQGVGIAERLMTLLSRQQNFVTLEGGPSYRVRVEARHGVGAARISEVVITQAPTRLAPFFVTSWTG